eukprot:2760620-Amphidinium_carterae.1
MSDHMFSSEASAIIRDTRVRQECLVDRLMSFFALLEAEMVTRVRDDGHRVGLGAQKGAGIYVLSAPMDTSDKKGDSK